MRTLLALLIASIALPAFAETCEPNVYVAPPESRFAESELELQSGYKPTLDGETANEDPIDVYECQDGWATCYSIGQRLLFAVAYRDEYSAIIYWPAEDGEPEEQHTWYAKCE